VLEHKERLVKDVEQKQHLVDSAQEALANTEAALTTSEQDKTRLMERLEEMEASALKSRGGGGGGGHALGGGGGGLSPRMLEEALGAVRKAVMLCEGHVTCDSPLAATLAELKGALHVGEWRGCI
jgi:hypothetical protein